MPIYTIIHGTPDAYGNITRFGTIASFFDKAKAESEFLDAVRQAEYQKIDKLKYLNPDSGEVFTIYTHLVF